MRKLLKCEMLKNRHRYVFLTALAVTAMGCVFAFYGDHTTREDTAAFYSANGWLLFLYQLPLIATIFFPILCAVVASRLCDTEHKGNNFKLLCTLTDKGRLYDAKLLYGLMITLSCVTLFWCVALVMGRVSGFAGAPPMEFYGLFLLFTIVPTVSIYCFQHALSMYFRNQAVPFFTGILGEFVGLFSLFLPYSFLRNNLIWGHYGALQFMGLYGYDKETRYRYAYMEHMGYNWPALAGSVVCAVILYLAGRRLFQTKND